jgi:hypothetical protein
LHSMLIATLHQCEQQTIIRQTLKEFICKNAARESSLSVCVLSVIVAASHHERQSIQEPSKVVTSKVFDDQRERSNNTQSPISTYHPFISPLIAALTNNVSLPPPSAFSVFTSPKEAFSNLRESQSIFAAPHPSCM